MALTFQSIYTQVQNLSNDNTSNSAPLLKSLVNQTQNNLLSYRKDITETSSTQNTVAGQQAYYLPYNYGKMYAMTITVGAIAYPLFPIEDDTLWYQINARSSSYTSVVPSNYFITNDQFFIYPKPSASANVITMYYHKVVKDMTADDYTTGTVSALANGGTTVTGSGTTWTSAMVGRFIRITSDGYWYEISAFISTTSLTLKKAYQGTTITAGSEVYTIGVMPLIPEAYNELLIWRPTAVYWMMRKEQALSSMYWHMYDGGYELSLGYRGKNYSPGGMLRQFIDDRSSKIESAIINPQLQKIKQDVMFVDPNAFPLGLTS